MRGRGRSVTAPATPGTVRSKVACGLAIPHAPRPMRIALLYNDVPPDAPAADRDVLVQVAVVRGRWSRWGMSWCRSPARWTWRACAAGWPSCGPTPCSTWSNRWLVPTGSSCSCRHCWMRWPRRIRAAPRRPCSCRTTSPWPRRGFAGRACPRRVGSGAGEPAPPRPVAYILKTACQHASFQLDEDSVIPAEEWGTVGRPPGGVCRPDKPTLLCRGVHRRPGVQPCPAGRA